MTSQLLRLFEIGIVIGVVGSVIVVLACCRVSAIAEEIERRLREAEYDERG